MIKKTKIRCSIWMAPYTNLQIILVGKRIGEKYVVQHKGEKEKRQLKRKNYMISQLESMETPLALENSNILSRIWKYQIFLQIIYLTLFWTLEIYQFKTSHDDSLYFYDLISSWQMGKNNQQMALVFLFEMKNIDIKSTIMYHKN